MANTKTKTKRFPKGVNTIHWPMVVPFGSFDPGELFIETYNLLKDEIPTRGDLKLTITVDSNGEHAEFTAFKYK